MHNSSYRILTDNIDKYICEVPVDPIFMLHTDKIAVKVLKSTVTINSHGNFYPFFLHHVQWVSKSYGVFFGKNVTFPIIMASAKILKCQFLEQANFWNRPIFESSVINTVHIGVIVQISSETDLPSPLVLRNRFNEYGCVAYVDRETPKAGYIRFNNQSGAQRSIEKEDFYSLSLLTAQKEEQYWESLLNKVYKIAFNIPAFRKLHYITYFLSSERRSVAVSAKSCAAWSAW